MDFMKARDYANTLWIMHILYSWRSGLAGAFSSIDSILYAPQAITFHFALRYIGYIDLEVSKWKKVCYLKIPEAILPEMCGFRFKILNGATMDSSRTDKWSQNLESVKRKNTFSSFT